MLTVNNRQREQVTFATPSAVRLKETSTGKLGMKGGAALDDHTLMSTHTAELSIIVRILIPLGLRTIRKPVILLI